MKVKDQELAQALTRVNISSISFVIVTILVFVLDNNIFFISFFYISLHLILSLLILNFIKRYPKESFARRVFAIILDLGIISAIVYHMGVQGAFSYPLYLWVIVGNGMRYGVKYLLISLGVAIISFAMAVYYSPLWQGELLFASALLMGFVILSLFYIKLIKQLHILNQKLSQELEKTKHASLHDPLTGLPNRSFFTTYLQKILSSSKRNKIFFAVAYIDLNSFKPVNDTYGHDYGDKLLQEVSNRIQTTLRESDFVARLGGDEFGIVLVTPDDIEGSMKCLNRLSLIISEPYTIFDKKITISDSIGLATYPYDGITETQLLKQADKNMYQNKTKNKNQSQLVD